MTAADIHPGYSDGSRSVVRVNDDGRTDVVHAGLREEAASLIAGALRDEQTDEDVGAGWNVLAMGRGELARAQRRAANRPVKISQEGSRSSVGTSRPGPPNRAPTRGTQPM